MARTSAAGRRTCFLIIVLLLLAAVLMGYQYLFPAPKGQTAHIFVDGKEVQVEAYTIHNNNFMQLRDVGKAVGFNVYWDSDNGCVQVESGKPYTGKPHPNRPPQPPQTVPGMFPRWVM